MCADPADLGRAATSSGLFAPPPARLQVAHDLGDAVGVRLRGVHARLRLHDPRLAAMSSIARVIFFVDCTDLMRRRRMRS